MRVWSLKKIKKNQKNQKIKKGVKKMEETKEKSIKKNNRGGKREGAGRKKSELPKDVKSKYWTIILYPENLIDNWKDKLYEIGLPMCYCLHNKTKVGDEDRKEHIHLIVACPNTTTYNHIMNIFKVLNKSDEEKAFNTVQIVYSMENTYNYLIHDTDDCRKKGKEPYDKKDRKCINNFDIGVYVQKSIQEEKAQRKEIFNIIKLNRFTNYFDLAMYIEENYDDDYLDVLFKYSGNFERLTRGLYHKEVQEEMRRQ